MQKKQILFLTGTRADFGKLKPLIKAVDDHPDYECKLFVTGMHMLEQYGFTFQEVQNLGVDVTFPYVNQMVGEPMDMILANTVHGLSRYIHDNPPDLIVVHGDRVEALAGAIVGSLRNIKTAHIEGGELSGTIDGLIRHSVSKLSHLHFVANEEAANRLEQMGEDRTYIYIIGSPDIDVMLSDTLPDIAAVKKYYEVPFKEYGISMFHTVTTELDHMAEYAKNYFDALAQSERNFVVVYPNNDEGTEHIMKALEHYKDYPKFRALPSMRFEYFLSLLKNAQIVTGNSSAGVREAPVYGIPTVNVGTRQQDRYNYTSILDTSYDKEEIAETVDKAFKMGRQTPSKHFGTGDSTTLFMDVLKQDSIWKVSPQKQFKELVSSQ